MDTLETKITEFANQVGRDVGDIARSLFGDVKPKDPELPSTQKEVDKTLTE